ncbi:50S ribosomal protein L31 [Helicobacter suis]|uniref:50S ribosomal protein L31 n=1 Tax=Helicobacter suis TaxID=104628 RepID=UPI00222EC47D|nr:50S ribosomal protein L31 [Helicobacter suis]
MTKLNQQYYKGEISVVSYIPCKVTCVTSGKEIEVLSTKSELRIDISSFCHPFYTGSDKIADTTGRVEKFRQKYKMQ